jgi:hypothetical protein
MSSDLMLPVTGAVIKDLQLAGRKSWGPGYKSVRHLPLISNHSISDGLNKARISALFADSFRDLRFSVSVQWCAGTWFNALQFCGLFGHQGLFDIVIVIIIITSQLDQLLWKLEDPSANLVKICSRMYKILLHYAEYLYRIFVQTNK